MLHDPTSGRRLGHLRGTWAVALFAIAMLAWCPGLAPTARAQVDEVIVEVGPEDVGLDGFVRPGAWTPMRILLNNKSSKARTALVEWVLNDADGDTVRMQREVALTPNATTRAWIYAVVPLASSRAPLWKVRVYDKESNQFLGQKQVGPLADKFRRPTEGFIAVTGSAGMGLDNFSEPYTQQERINFLRGFDVKRLPDRWYGLAMLDALVWTGEAGGPDAPEITDSMRRALHEWVERGGHLIIVLPQLGADDWLASKSMQALLPDVEARKVEGVPRPLFLGDDDPAKEKNGRLGIDEHILAPRSAKDTFVIHRETVIADGKVDDRPLVVTRGFGLGRVTMVGIDLSSREMVAARLPRSRKREVPEITKPFWQEIMAWKSPGFTEGEIDKAKKATPVSRMAELSQRNYTRLDAFIPNQVAMTETAGPALLGAIVVFVLYWLAAGPFSFAALKSRKRMRHSWVVFACVVLVFTAFTWLAALVIRPRATRVEHFTFLTVDAASGSVHAHSFLSLFAAKHGSVDLRIDPAKPEFAKSSAVIGTGGASMRADDAGFIDPQRYILDAGNPASALLPFRSTAKQLEIDFFTRLQPGKALHEQHGIKNSSWIMPSGSVAISKTTGMVAGQLQHGLPGTLRDVLFVYCRGDKGDPLVWTEPAWEPGKPLPMPKINQDVLYRRTFRIQQDGSRIDDHVGFLPKKMTMTAGEADDFAPVTGNKAAKVSATGEAARIINESQVFSFFSMLPPPEYEKVQFPYPKQFQRILSRSHDLSQHTVMKRLIVIGHLPEGPVPVPMTVDGYEPSSRGWTVLQWILPLEEEK